MAISAKDVKELRERTGAGMMDCKKALEETNGDFDKAVDLLREKGLSQAAKKASRITAEGLVDMMISDDKKYGAIVEVNSETDFVAKNAEFIEMVNDICKVIVTNKPADLEALNAMDYLNEGKSVETVLNEKIAKIGENMSIRRFAVEEGDKGGVFGYIHGSRIAVLVNLETDGNLAELEELGKDIAIQVASMNPKYLSRDEIDEGFIAHEKEVLMNQALNENEEDVKAGKKEKPLQILEKIVEGRLQKSLQEVCLLDQVFVKDGDMNITQLINKTSKDLGISPVKIKSFVRYEVGEGLEKRVEDFQAEVAKQLEGK